MCGINKKSEAVLVIAGASIACVEMLRSGDENENSSRTSFKRESSSIDESSFEQESSSDEESSSVDCSSSSLENSSFEENSSGEESSNREESSSVDISNEESSSADSSSSSSDKTEKTPSEGLEFSLLDNGTYYEVSGIGSCSDNDLVIPSTYNNLPVKSIGSYAFSGCSRLTSVAIPDSVTTIDYEAFYGCSSLQYNEYDNAKYLGNENNPYVALLKATSTDITSCTIHKNTKVIADSAFRYCSKLTSVVIPDSVTSIGYVAFDGCSSLTSVVIPESVTIIGAAAFYNCNSLTIVVIPDSVSSIGGYAFSYCSSLMIVVLPASVTGIGNGTFSRCSSLTSIEVSKNNSTYKSIDGNLYSKDGKTLIQYAVGKTATLFTIPDGVTSIGYSAFEGCSSLLRVVIPDSVTSIGDEAFALCDFLTSIEVSENNNSYKSIDGNLYSKDGKTLMQYAIGKTETSFTIPDSVTGIGDWAFFCCSSLTSVTIGNSVTSIGDWAFDSCSSLTSVVIPDSVTSIGSSAFSWCSRLKSITFNGTKEQWNAIEKGSNWKGSAIKEIVCTDGTVSV